MKKRVWMVISLILAFVPLLIPLEGGHGLAPLEKWVARYNGPANSYDDATAIALDSSGNVYVTGTSNDNYATIKYNTNGKQLWVKTYDGPDKEGDEASAIAVDRSGNVYVTGYSLGLGDILDASDYVTIKYNTNGKQLWVKRYNGPAKKGDVAKAIAVDRSGNVYVTGWSGSDYATIKYNTNGKQLWVKRYNGPANSYADPNAISVDSSGNVYVTGTSGDDYATIKYNTNGKQLWVKTYDGPDKEGDGARAIAVDRSGNVYVTGWSYCLGVFAEGDYATIKYNTNGKQLWVKRYNGPANGDDDACAIALDSLGNVYVTGGTESLGGWDYSDYATIKYDTNGKQLWVKRYNGPANNRDYATAIAVDSSGNVYVTGFSYWLSYSLGGSTDYATIKYNTNGKQLWAKRYNGQVNGDAAATAIAADSSGNVYVTGGSSRSGTGYDYTTIKY